MTLVVDASVVVSALTETGPRGDWSRRIMGSDTLAAPHVLPVEVAKVLRRMTQSSEIDDSQAFTAHQTLLSLSIALFPYSQTGERVWQLRHTVTVQDACFVALAEGLDSDLVTFDLPLTRAPGPRCRFLTPAV